MNHDQVIKDAQYRKGLSIAFFNATNAAIELTKNEKITGKKLRNKIVEVRDWLLEEHKTYYATVIANVGTNYKPEETIKRLKATKTLEDLRSTWQLLSEDERQDKEIKKIVHSLKKTYEKA